VKKGWSEVALTDVATLTRRQVLVEEDGSYPEVGVRCFGKGLFHKLPRTGLEVGDKKLFALRRGDFIIQVTFAWEGAVGIVSEADESFFGSVRVLTFEIDAGRCERRFLFWYFRTKAGVEQLARISPGSAGRNRVLAIGRLGEVRIPLPQLAEQQRIVAHLEAIQARLTRAQKLREEEQKEKLALTTSLAHRRDLDAASKQARAWQKAALRDVLQQTSETVLVDSTASYPNIGIYSYGRGTFTKAPIEGTNTSATQLFRVQAGQFIYSRLFAFEGAYALVQPSQDGHYVSNEFPSFTLDSQRILSEFLFAYFKSPVVWTELAEQSTGLGNRRQRIHPEVILAHKIDLPPIEYQAKVRDAFLKLEQARASLGDAELNALLPSSLDQIFNP
jgi:type I restriction enzyme, S subunit